jgi:tripartite-type tricarboxylate transporter receptor subunit TctC
MRKSLLRLVASAVLLAATGLCQAAAFPDKPVRLLVGYGPGSSTDLVGRIVAQGLSELWKQPVLLENRPGAAGNIAADTVAKSQADGYTMLFAQNGLAISVAGLPGLSFNGTKDLLPVAGVAATPHILVVNATSPVHSVAELVALARAKPNKLNFGSSGIGNSDHMAGELFKVLAGVEALHIPYKSGALAATDLIGGQLDFYFAGMPVGLPLVKAGRVHALAVTGTARYTGAPEVPTMQEAGVKDYEMTLWQGVFLPAGVPRNVADAIEAGVLKVLDDPVTRDRLAKAGAVVAPLSQRRFSDLYLGDIARWKRIIPAAKIKLD